MSGCNPEQAEMKFSVRMRPSSEHASCAYRTLPVPALRRPSTVEHTGRMACIQNREHTREVDMNEGASTGCGWPGDRAISLHFRQAEIVGCEFVGLCALCCLVLMCAHALCYVVCSLRVSGSLLSCVRMLFVALCAHALCCVVCACSLLRCVRMLFVGLCAHALSVFVAKTRVSQTSVSM